MLAPLKCRRKRKKKIDQSTNVDRAELPKILLEVKQAAYPSGPYPTNPQVSLLSLGVQKAGRDHVLHAFFSSPQDSPRHSSLGQISGGVQRAVVAISALWTSCTS